MTDAVGPTAPAVDRIRAAADSNEMPLEALPAPLMEIVAALAPLPVELTVPSKTRNERQAAPFTIVTRRKGRNNKVQTPSGALVQLRRSHLPNHGRFGQTFEVGIARDELRAVASSRGIHE
jgi:hypothetical protein